MVYSNAKAIALLRDLSDRLKTRLAGNSGLNTVAEAFYTDGNGAVWPYLLISNGTDGSGEGEPVVLIEISGLDAVSKDVFGNELYSYAPHLMQFGYELTSGGAPIPSRGDLLICEVEALKCGVRFQVKEVANGTAVTGASVNAASPVADLEDLYWPTKSV